MDRAELTGRWVHAHEEDTDDEMVFRAGGEDLPPARGRVSFELYADGTCTEAGLGAADVPDVHTGRWTLEGDRLLLSEGAVAGVPREMTITRADAERLVVRKPTG